MININKKALMLLTSLNLVLYNIALSSLINDTYTTNENNKVYDENFVKQIYIFNNIYCTFIKKYYNIDLKDINKLDLDINGIIEEIRQKANYGQYSWNDYTEQAKKILDKYPMVNLIMRSDFISIYDYKDAIKNNRYIKKTF